MMTKTISMLALLLLSVFPNRQALQYQLKKGDAFVLEQTTEQTITQRIMGMEQVIQNAISGTIQFEVTEELADAYQMKAKYNRLGMSMSMMGNEQTMSSDSVGDPASLLYGAIVKEFFYFKLHKKGGISNVKLAEGARERILEATGSTDNPQVSAALDQMFSEKSLKYSFAEIFPVLPEETVKKGYKWNFKTEQGQFPVVANNTLIIAEMGKDGVRLDILTEMTTTDPSKVNELANGMKVKYNLNGERKGALQLDPATLLISAAEMKGTLSGNMTMLKGGMIPEDMDVPMDIKTETLYTISNK